MIDNSTRDRPKNLEFSDREVDLEDRIKLQRGVHNVLQEKTNYKLKFQKFSNIILSALITLVVFTDITIFQKIYPNIDQPRLMILVGIMALVLFLTNSLFDSFLVDSSNSLHIRAIQQYTDLVFDMKTAKVKSEGNPLTEDEINHFYRRYLQISENTHTSTGKTFDDAQKKYLQRKALRHARKERPFATKREIRRRAVEISQKDLEN